MKKVLTLMLGLVAGTASFANSTTTEPTTAVTHVAMTPDHKLNFYVQPLQTKAQLAIRDTQGHPVYVATVSLQKGIRQQYDISGLSAGTYRLTLTTGDETITKTFVVQANPNESFLVQ